MDQQSFEKSGQPPAAAGMPPAYSAVASGPPQPYPGQQPVAYPPPGQQWGQPAQGYQYGQVVVQQPLAAPAVSGPPPPDYLVQAILVTLCCFWPTGLFAIIKASDSRSAAARGDYSLAHSYAKSAHSFIKISLIVGIIVMVVTGILVGVYIGVVLKALREHDYDWHFDD